MSVAGRPHLDELARAFEQMAGQVAAVMRRLRVDLLRFQAPGDAA